MQVILLEDVKKLGKKGEIVEISDGYARNFVLPKKLGVEANSKNRNDLKLQKANADKIAKEQLGNGSKWNEIYEANRKTIKNPNLIYIGQELIINK